MSGYHVMALDEESKPKSAFTCSAGHYEYNVMAFGLAGAPQAFSRLINTVFKKELRENILCVYLDDLMIGSATFDDHLYRLKRVFDVLRSSNLTLKASKCFLAFPSVQVLGHVLDKDGIHPNPDKVKAILQMPAPMKVKQLKGFLAMCGLYRSFIKNFSAIATPLHALLKKDSPYV